MNPLVFLVGCVVFGTVIVFYIVGVYKVRPSQGWRALIRTVTPHAQARSPPGHPGYRRAEAPTDARPQPNAHGLL